MEQEHMDKMKEAMIKMDEACAIMHEMMDKSDELSGGDELKEKEYMSMPKEKRVEYDRKQVLGKVEEEK